MSQDSSQKKTKTQSKPVAGKQPPVTQIKARSFLRSKAQDVLGGKIILEVKRHWAGLVGLCLGIISGLLLASLLLSLVGVVGGLFDSFVVILLVLTVAFVICVLAARVYWGNQLIVSETSICQITCYAIFSSKASILGLANIEDVTVVREGVFAHFWGYGILNIETAGEQDNFKFLYCPQPENCAHLIMELREKYLRDNPAQKLRWTNPFYLRVKTRADKDSRRLKLHLFI